MFLLLLAAFWVILFAYDSGGLLIYGPSANTTAGLVPTYQNQSIISLDIFIDNGACPVEFNNSAIHAQTIPGQCRYFVGINNQNPQCELDVDGEICINGTPLGSLLAGPWYSDNSITGVQTFTPSFWPDVDISFIHAYDRAFTRTLSNSSGDYGDTRGPLAVDFQTNRTSADQVAAATYSTILNGDSNKISSSATYCAVLGGSSNWCDSLYSVIGNGLNNTCTTSDYSFIQNGQRVQVTNYIHSVAAGLDTTITDGQYSFIGTGERNIIHQCTQGGCVIINGKDNMLNTTERSELFIGTGSQNSIVDGFRNTIMNGFGNKIFGGFPPQYNSISNGIINSIFSGSRNTILNGFENEIDAPVRQDQSISNFVASGFRNKIIDGYYAVILNGITNSINTSSQLYATILNGEGNQCIQADYCLLGNGFGNSILQVDTEGFSTALNGKNNVISISDYSTILGGQGVQLTNSSYSSAAGLNNVITDSYYSTILGAQDSQVTNSIHSVAAGFNTTITDSDRSFVGTGQGNSILQSDLGVCVIVNGNGNTISTGFEHFIGTGTGNSIVSGFRNTILNGFENKARAVGLSSAQYALIGGGFRNLIETGVQNVVLNGFLNELLGGFRNTILNGFQNKIDPVASTDQNLIGNGNTNLITDANECSILNGDTNEVSGATIFATILNGDTNKITVSSDYSAILGGLNNILTSSTYTTVGSSNGNSVSNSANVNVLTGVSNTVNASNDLLLTGQGNVVTGTQGSFVGGFASTVLGFTAYVTMSNGFGNNVTGSAVSRSDYHTIGNGQQNKIDSPGRFFTTILNGQFNVIQGVMDFAAILNGASGRCDAATYCLIGNGFNNQISGFSQSSILNGQDNTINGAQSTILSGAFNNILGDNNVLLSCSSCTVNTLSNFNLLQGITLTVPTNSDYNFLLGNNLRVTAGSNYNLLLGDTVQNFAANSESVLAVGKNNFLINDARNTIIVGRDNTADGPVGVTFIAQQLFGVGLVTHPSSGLFTGFGQWNNVANDLGGDVRQFTYGDGASTVSRSNKWSFSQTSNMRINGAYLGGPPSGEAMFYEHSKGTKLEPGTVVALNDDGMIEPCTHDSPKDCFGVVTEVGAGVVGGAWDEEYEGKYERSVHRKDYRKHLSKTYDPERKYISRTQRDEWHVVVRSGLIEILNGQPAHPSWRKLPKKKNPPPVQGYTWWLISSACSCQ